MHKQHCSSCIPYRIFWVRLTRSHCPSSCSMSLNGSLLLFVLLHKHLKSTKYIMQYYSIDFSIVVILSSRYLILTFISCSCVIIILSHSLSSHVVDCYWFIILRSISEVVCHLHATYDNYIH